MKNRHTLRATTPTSGIGNEAEDDRIPAETGEPHRTPPPGTTACHPVRSPDLSMTP